MHVLLEDDDGEEFKKQIIEATSAEAIIEEGGTLYKKVAWKGK